MADDRDDYLWDRGGAVDPEVARLEELMRPLRHDVATTIANPLQPRSVSVRMFVVTSLALAATLLLLVGTTFYAGREQAANPTVVAAAGAPRLENRAIGSETGWRPGNRLETDASSSARVVLPDLGQVDVLPSSRVRFVGVAAGVYRLRLDRGQVQAFITAPAGRFVVDTPQSVAVDLGCSYVLEVGEFGSRLRVTSGLVALAGVDRESLIPAGYLCATPSPGAGCTPVAFDASPAYQQAVHAIDLHVESPYGMTADSIIRVLHGSRPEDAVTLWHLLFRVAEPDRTPVYERLAQLAPPPPGVTQEGILRGDRAMRDLWWNTFGFGAIELWRTLSYRITPANN